MRARASLVVSLVVIPAIALAAEEGFVADRKAYAEDERLAVILKSISDAKRFDETAARRMMPALLNDGLSREEVDLYYEIIAARTPIEISAPFGPAFRLPPPDGAAREYMGLLKTVIESPNIEATLEERWLTGPRQFKELVDIWSFGGALANTINVYFSRKLGADWMNSSEANGYAPLKDDLTKIRMQLSQTDINTEQQGKAIAYNVLRELDRSVDGAIPDELYSDLNP